MPRLERFERVIRKRVNRGGVTVSLQADFRAIAADFRYLFDEKVYLRKGVQAINRSASRTETKAVREISGDTGIPVSRVRWRYTEGGRRTKRRRFRKTTATSRNPFVTFRASPLDPPINTIGNMVQRKQRGGGIVQAGRMYRGAFIQSPRGNPVALKRTGSSRYPIEPVRRNFKPQANINMNLAIGGTGKVTFVSEFERLMRLELKRPTRRVSRRRRR